MCCTRTTGVSAIFPCDSFERDQVLGEPSCKCRSMHSSGRLLERQAPQIGLWVGHGGSACAAELLATHGLRLAAARCRTFAERSAHACSRSCRPSRPIRVHAVVRPVQRRRGPDQAISRHRRADPARAHDRDARSRRRASSPRRATRPRGHPRRRERHDARVALEPDRATISRAPTRRCACWCRSNRSRGWRISPQIAAVDGVDGVFFGPADLAASMGLIGKTADAVRCGRRSPTASPPCKGAGKASAP